MSVVVSSSSRGNIAALDVHSKSGKHEAVRFSPLDSIKVAPSRSQFCNLRNSRAVTNSFVVKSSLDQRETLRPFSELPPRQSQVEDDEAGEDAARKSRDPTTWRVKDVVKAAVVAFSETPIETLGSAAIYAAVLAGSSIVANNMLDSVNSLPLLSETLKTIGVGYCGIVVSHYLIDNRLTLEPLSPIRAIIKLSDLSPMDALKEAGFEVPENLDVKVQEALKKILDQRDAALSRVKELEKTGERMVKLMAEKEALEAVAMQLAQERHQARWEADALRTAVKEMTQRMKAVESSLDTEVNRLQENNLALETVAMQLVAERDQALKQADEARVKLESVIKRLTEERDRAFVRVDELQKVVANFREAYSSASGLTNEQESFIKARIRVIRSNFVDISKPYTDQKEAVDKLVSHLVDEYGAPPDWTSNYIKQFLNSSAMDGRNLNLKSTVKSEVPKNGVF